MAEENFKQFKDEVIRHFDVVAEDLKGEIQTVAEQVAQNSENITEIKQDVKGAKGSLETINLNIEVIKNDLKQKVGRDEFVILERRVGILEAKSR